MDVSIVVVAWNVRDELLACLTSIEEHGPPLDIEVIVVDNGSTDGTADAVAERFPDARVLQRPTNEGVFARNYGLRLARGRLRMFLDSDALLTAGALQRLVRVFADDDRVGLAGPRLTYPSGQLQQSARRFPPLTLPLLRRPPLARFFDDGPTVRHHLMADDAHDRLREVEYVLGACQIFREEAQQVAGEIDPWMFYGHDDADWCFRIRRAGFKVVYCPEAQVIHNYRRSTAQRPFSRMALKYLWTFVRFQWKWRGERRALIDEGRRMDERAGRASGAETAAA